HGGDVHRLGAVAAGADDVDRGAGHVDHVGVVVERPDAAGDLLDRLALGPQGHRETGDLRVGGLTAHDQVHRPGGVVGRQVTALQQAVQQGGPGAARRGVASSGGHSAHQPLLLSSCTSAPTLSSVGHGEGPRPSTGRGPSTVVWRLSVSRSGDQWWPWPLVISLYSSAVGLGMWETSPY